MQTLNTTVNLSEIDVEDDREWRDNAACRDTDPDLFFPVGTTGMALEQIRAAKTICRMCDSRSDCLDYALVNNQESGIWGGTSEEERKALRRAWIARQRRTA